MRGDCVRALVLVMLLLFSMLEAKKIRKKLKLPHRRKKISHDVKVLDGVGRHVGSLLGPFEGAYKMKGCYPNPTTFYNKREDSYNTNNECAAFCSEFGKNIFATGGKICFCLDTVPSSGKTSPLSCSSTCPGEINKDARCIVNINCCGGGTTNVTVFEIETNRRRDIVKRSSDSLNIQGCFDDTVSNVLTREDTVKRIDSQNTLLRCNGFCLEKGFPVAALRTDHCYCTNVLPLDRLYEGSDGSRECSLFCSGIYQPSGQCERDECCGGQDDEGRNTYTVFISGTLDVLKQTIRRFEQNLVNDPDFLDTRVLDGESFCPGGWTKHGLSCIKLGSGKKTFSAAKADCESQNAHLITITNTYEDEQFWINKVQQDLPINDKAQDFSTVPGLPQWYVWIGMRYNSELDIFEWENGTPAPHFTEDQSTTKSTACSSGFFVIIPGDQYNSIYYRLRNNWCNWRTYYYCQSYAKIAVSGMNPTSSASDAPHTFQTYSMQLAFPGIVSEASTVPEDEIPDTSKILNLAVVDFEEQIKKESTPSSDFLAGSDVLFRNKDGRAEAKFIYSHAVETSSGTTVSKSSGASVAVSVGMEFKTSYFGLAEHAFSAGLEVSGSWEQGREVYDSETISHSYTFEFPIPEGCDATIAVMKNEVPTRIDWRASFYASGWMDIVAAGNKRSIDVSRILSSSQRYLYSFGTNDFGDRPTIVPVNTLDCNDPEQDVTREPLVTCTNPDTGEPEECRVPLTPPSENDSEHKKKKKG